MQIVTAATNDFVPGVMLLAESVRRFTKEPWHICVIDLGLNSGNVAKLQTAQLEVRPAGMPPCFKGSVLARHTLMCYLKPILVQQLFPAQKVMWLDADVLALGPLEELWRLGDERFVAPQIAADTALGLTAEFFNYYPPIAAKGPLLCSGVYVSDVARDCDIWNPWVTMCTAVIAGRIPSDSVRSTADQPLLNYQFRRNPDRFYVVDGYTWCRSPGQANMVYWPARFLDCLQAANRDAKLLHVWGQRKYWHGLHRPRQWASVIDTRHMAWMQHVLQAAPFRTIVQLGCDAAGQTTAALSQLVAANNEQQLVCVSPSFTNAFRQSIAGKDQIQQHAMSPVRFLHDELQNYPSEYAVFIDGSEVQEFGAAGVDMLLRHRPLCLFSHDTGAVIAGMSKCGGALLLRQRFSTAPDYYVLEDLTVRPGEGTERGMFMATRCPDLFAAAKAGYTKYIIAPPPACLPQVHVAAPMSSQVVPWYVRSNFAFAYGHIRTTEQDRLWRHYRMWIYLSYTLPSLLRQTDPDFRIWMRCPAGMEAEMQPFLPALAENNVLVTFGNAIYREWIKDTDTIYVTHLDSDDVLADDAIAASRKIQGDYVCSQLLQGYIYFREDGFLRLNPHPSPPFYTLRTRITANGPVLLVSGEHCKVRSKYAPRMVPGYRHCMINHGWNSTSRKREGQIMPDLMEYKLTMQRFHLAEDAAAFWIARNKPETLQLLTYCASFQHQVHDGLPKARR